MSVSKVCVVGLGHVGVPLLKACHSAGYKTFGIDKNPIRTQVLEKEFSHLSADSMFSSHFDVVQDVDIVIVCVPTPLNTDLSPDYSHVFDASKEIGRKLSKNRHQLVIIESTVAPGTTSGRIKDILESQSGLKAGRDFSLAYSPERIDPNNSKFRLENTPKVVSGLTKKCTDLASSFYGSFVSEVVTTGRIAEAESAKILENAYRQINISFINEFSGLLRDLGIDARETIRLAGTKPFGFETFLPGVGAGGHCIPVDPIYLQDLTRSKLGRVSEMIELALDINQRRPNLVAEAVSERLRLVLG